MSLPSRIQDLVVAMLAGRKIDPVGFLDELLVATAPRYAGR